MLVNAPNPTLFNNMRWDQDIGNMAGKPVLLTVFNSLLYPVLEELTADP